MIKWKQIEEEWKETIKTRILYVLSNNTYTILEEELDSIIDESTKMIVFDMTDLEYLSSAGVRVFLKARKALQANDGKITFMNLQPQVKKVFEIINAIPSMQIFQSVEELDRYLDDMQKQILESKS